MDLITMIGNTGTCLDNPVHRYPQGGDLASVSLDPLVDQPARVFHLTDAFSRGIAADAFDRRGSDLVGTAVLLHTGWDARSSTPEYAVGAPYLTEEAARRLVEAGVSLVGFDSLNIDDTESGGERPARSRLLAAASTWWSTSRGSRHCRTSAPGSRPCRRRLRASALSG